MTNEKRRTLPGYWTTGIVSVSLLLGFVLMAAQQSPSTHPDDKGRAVFSAKGCANCHAVYGHGIDGKKGKGGPDLGNKKFYGTYLDLAAVLWNHFPKMFRRMKREGYEPPELTQEEVKGIISYLSFIRYMGEPGNVRTGRKLLRSKGCLSCHKVGGEGGDIGPDFSKKEEYLAPPALVESLWNHGPEMLELFQEHNVKRPEFKGDEIVDIAAAIRSYMSPTRVPPGAFDLGDSKNGKRLAEEKGCMQCHSFRGAGGTIGPDFFEVDFNHSVTEIAGTMWNHGPKMWETMKRNGIAFPTFKQGEMTDLISYLYELKLEDAPGELDRGSALIRNRDCLSCHSVQGEGAKLSQDLAGLGNLDSPLAMVTRMWNHASAMEEQHLEQKVKWPEFTGRDMADLYAYLHALSQSPR